MHAIRHPSNKHDFSVRVRRRPWMRALPGVRLFECSHCVARSLRISLGPWQVFIRIH